MTGVEQAHGIDFSGGIPAAYAVLGGLLDGVIRGVAPDFDIVKLEGDAVFACAPAAGLDGQEYPDAGPIEGGILDLGDPLQEGVPT